jgi:transglutaminase-like putative cysteine protease
MALLLALLLSACQGTEATPTIASFPTDSIAERSAGVIVSSVHLDVWESLTIVNEGPGRPQKHNLWLALISDHPPYQSVSSMEIEPGDYSLTVDEYGNRYAQFDLTGIPAGESRSIEVRYRLVLNEVDFDLAPCQGPLPDAFTQPELHVESNNTQIVELSQELSAETETVCESVRAFYDYVGDTLVYSYNGADWGAQAALGPMGADCTEYASLLTALCRASGVPARYLEGLRVLDAESGEDDRIEHAWVEVYLPGSGWMPADPTLGRSSLSREQYFARFTPDRIIVTVGRNPSTLRGSNYWTHIYWPGDSAEISVRGFRWAITSAVGKP